MVINDTTLPAPGTYNYIDPDNFFSVSALISLICSGEPFLQEEARIFCVGEVQKTNNCTYGQLPFHFEKAPRLPFLPCQELHRQAQHILDQICSAVRS